MGGPESSLAQRVARPMPRSDLLSLSLDDLAVLTNRGTVETRRARAFESGEVTGGAERVPDGDGRRPLVRRRRVPAPGRQGRERGKLHGAPARRPRCAGTWSGPSSPISGKLRTRTGADWPRAKPVRGTPVRSATTALAAAFKPAALARAPRVVRPRTARRAGPEHEAQRAVPCPAPHRPVPGAGRPSLHALRLRRAIPLPPRSLGHLGVPDARPLGRCRPALDPDGRAPGPIGPARRPRGDAARMDRRGSLGRSTLLGRPAGAAGGAVPRRRPGLAGGSARRARASARALPRPQCSVRPQSRGRADRRARHPVRRDPSRDTKAGPADA